MGVVIGSKQYYEKYAKLSLIYFYNKSLANLEEKDRPDLQSNIYDIGIEVTRSIKSKNNNVGVTQGIVNKYFGRRLSYKEMKKEVKNVKTFRGKLYNFGGATAISPTRGMFNTSIIVKRINNSILGKLIKLNGGNYQIFNSNGLYIFTGTSILNEKDIKKVLIYEKASRKKYQRSFDIYFIDCIDKLFIFDCQNDDLKVIEIEDTVLANLNNQAKTE